MTSAEICVKNLDKSFRESQVLYDIDITIDSGDFCVVVGPSGCGKSTLLECVAGLVSFDKGHVFVDGIDITNVPVEKREMGFVFQEFEETLFPHMTVWENVSFGLRQSDQEYSSGQIDQRVNNILDLLAISETKHDKPSELSGGQQQRVELARQLVRECEIMLLDDPLADLDYKLQKRMELEIRRIHAESEGTFIYVTHNQDQALKLADKLVVMHDGRIEQVGTPTEIYEYPTNAFVKRFIGDTNILDGKMVDYDTDGTVTVETAIGEVVAQANNDDLDPKSDAVVLIRPEDVTVGEAAKGMDNTLDGHFENRTYTGEMTEFIFSVNSTGGSVEFDVIQPGNVSLDGTEEHGQFTLGWNPVDATYFDDISIIETETVDDLHQI